MIVDCIDMEDVASVSYSRLTSTPLSALGLGDQGNARRGMYAVAMTSEEGVVVLLLSFQAMAGQM